VALLCSPAHLVLVPRGAAHQRICSSRHLERVLCARWQRRCRGPTRSASQIDPRAAQAQHVALGVRAAAVVRTRRALACVAGTLAGQGRPWACVRSMRSLGRRAQVGSQCETASTRLPPWGWGPLPGGASAEPRARGRMRAGMAIQGARRELRRWVASATFARSTSSSRLRQIVATAGQRAVSAWPPSAARTLRGAV
jgi:hypothetical protein